VPHHSNETVAMVSLLPKNVRRATRGLMIELEPAIDIHERGAPVPLDIAATEAETPSEVLDLAAQSREAIAMARDETDKWVQSLPSNAAESEIVTLGTGSALPSKYRNVSATLLRHPGWGSMLFDCGENTFGQLKRVYGLDGVKEVLRDLRMIIISHMHADHHLGTVGVIKAWYEEVHGSLPLDVPDQERRDTFDTRSGLAIIAEPAMIQWLSEYSSVEDYGWSRLAPLSISAHTERRSRLGWFLPPTTLARQPSNVIKNEMLEANVLPPDRLGLKDIQAVHVQHCHGARAVSVTFTTGFKASYSGDCRPSKSFSRIGKGSTVCIHEATFDDELLGDAQAKNHSTTSEALGVAQAMGAKACVLTHFSQRYQKLPVLDHGNTENNGTAHDDVEMDEGLNPEDDMAGPLEDAAATFPDQPQVGESQEAILPKYKHDQTPEAVRFKLTSDMKVAVAFDYMRVKMGEIPHMEHYVPPLLKLFEEEDTSTSEVVKMEDKSNGQKKKSGKNRSQRGNA
jgi:ribonuclease Z